MKVDQPCMSLCACDGPKIAFNLYQIWQSDRRLEQPPVDWHGALCCCTSQEALLKRDVMAVCQPRNQERPDLIPDPTNNCTQLDTIRLLIYYEAQESTHRNMCVYEASEGILKCVSFGDVCLGKCLLCMILL